MEYFVYIIYSAKLDMTKNKKARPTGDGMAKLLLKRSQRHMLIGNGDVTVFRTSEILKFAGLFDVHHDIFQEEIVHLSKGLF